MFTLEAEQFVITPPVDAGLSKSGSSSMLSTGQPISFLSQFAGMVAPSCDLPGRCFFFLLGASRLTRTSRPSSTDVPYPLYNNFSGGGRGLFSAAKSSSSSVSSSLRSPARVVRSAVVAVLSSSSSPSSRIPSTLIFPSIFPMFIPHTRGYAHASLSCAYGERPYSESSPSVSLGRLPLFFLRSLLTPGSICFAIQVAYPSGSSLQCM